MRRKRIAPEGEPITVTAGTYEPIDKSAFPPRMLQMGPAEFENLFVNILDKYFSTGKAK
jgi:hypothetical protein